MKQGVPEEAWDLTSHCMGCIGPAFVLVLIVCAFICGVAVYLLSVCVVLLSRGVDWTLGKRGDS